MGFNPSGSVRKRYSTWSYRIDFGVVDGKRKQIEKGGFSSKSEANAAMAIKIAEIIKNNEIKNNYKYTLNDVYDDFIINVAPMSRKPTTIKKYTSVYNNHIHELGDKLIEDITTKEVQSFLAKLISTKGLSNEYVKGIYTFMLVLFTHAVDMEYIGKNIMKKVKPPKVVKTIDDIKIYTMDEVKIIWNRIKDTNNATAFMIALKLGLRAGEIYALRWSDIDFVNNTVNINKQLQLYDKKWSLTTLKTPNSYRKIRFDGEFKEYMLEVKRKQDEFRSLLGDMYKTNTVYNTLSEKDRGAIVIDDFVNVKPNGQMLNTDSPRFVGRICKEELGIDFKIHNLRHTHATLLLEKGQNPKYISERLGHANATFTLKLYTHITRAMDDSALDALNFKL